MFKKFNSIFERKEKIKFLYLLILIVLGTILEVLGIGLIIPIILIFIEGIDGIVKLKFLISYISYINNFEKDNLITFSIIVLLIIYLAKYFILTILYFYQQNFLSNVLIRISNSILKNYLSKPYSFFLTTNSSKLINNLIRQSETFITQGLEPILYILSETVILIGIILFLIFFEPFIVFFSLFSILLPSIIFYFLIKKKAKRWGFLQQKYNENVIKNLQQTIDGIKEIKIFNRQNDFIKTFNYSYTQTTKIRRNMQFFNHLPRIWLELLALIFICIYVFFLLKTKTGSEIVVILALFSIAIFRILPSLNRIILAAQNLRYGFAAVDTVYSELKNCNESKKREYLLKKNFISFEKISFVNVSFAYNEIEVLKNINLDICRGQFIGIGGKTGAGKSTFINLLTGLLRPSAGKIIINNTIEFNESVEQTQDWQNRIGYAPQAYSLLDDSIEKNVTFEDDVLNIDFNWFRECLSIAEITDFVDQLPEKSKSKIGERGIRISGGQKQRIVIARALYKKPEILILDEATNALDELTERKIINNILNLKKQITLISISHKNKVLKNNGIIYEIKDNQIINCEK